MRLVMSSVAASLLSLTLGCRTDQGRFTVLSTRNVEISRVDLKHVPLDRSVSGSDGRLWFLFIPLGSAPTIDKAVDSCLRSGEGNFMVNTRLSSFWWTVLLFSYESYAVNGDVGNSIGPGSREVMPSPDPPATQAPGVDHN